MKKTILKAALVVSILAFGITMSCSDDDSPKITTVTQKQVIDNYAKIVHQNYIDSYNSAKKLQTSINAFIANPSQATLDKAKQDWLAARDIYGQSEVFRGSDGPIDSKGKPWALDNEGQLNAWPLNEAYIDYVALKTSYTGTYDKSIITGTAAITKASIAGVNQPGSDEQAVSTGWHAIEFLLWGQDNTKPAEKKKGLRPFTDYTTKANAARRKQYLKAATDLLVDDLKALVDTWSAPNGTYYKVFKGLSEKVALTNILKGPAFLASFELSSERLLKPAVSTKGIDGSGQEDEHSCFSDNTHRDAYTNAMGIINVLQGEYNTIKGASPIDLITQKDAAQGAKLVAEIAKMKAAIKAIDDKAKAGTPFDLMLVQEGASNPGLVLAADKAVKDLSAIIIESAAKINISLTATTG